MHIPAYGLIFAFQNCGSASSWDVSIYCRSQWQRRLSSPSSPREAATLASELGDWGWCSISTSPGENSVYLRSRERTVSLPASPYYRLELENDFNCLHSHRRTVANFVIPSLSFTSLILNLSIPVSHVLVLVISMVIYSRDLFDYSTVLWGRYASMPPSRHEQGV